MSVRMAAPLTLVLLLMIHTFWTKTQLQGMYGEYPDLSEDPEYSQRLQYLGDKQQNCDLRLSHVTKNDEHEYYFTLTTNIAEWIGTPGVRLFVTDLQLESPERVKEGDSVRLTCNSRCNLTDTPTFIWYRNSETLTKGSVQNDLVYSSISRRDAGYYSCGVQGHNYTSPAVYLDVRYSPGIPVISIRGSAVMMEGDSVTLSCSSDSNPPAEIKWYKGKKYIERGKTFKISKISFDGSGKYKCGARNVHGEKYSDPVILNVQYSPKSVSVSISGSAVIMSGDSVTLSCSSDSNPPAEINWFKGETLVGSRRIFSISNISSDDNGEYKCRARNDHGEKYSDPVTLDVPFHRSTITSVITATSGGLFIIIIIITTILFVIRRKRMNRRSSPNIYENDGVSANTYAGLDLQSRSSDLYNTLTTVHPSPAVHQASSSEYENLPVN
ncbi:B-cell receptor CD22-like isoform X2 [Danio rerio]|uniref:B-cell receptor CD22-like isoform X2 n=1 Tax=Danio rerio TaxID=7955 RepID=A0AC58G2K5_DANRE